MSEQTTPTEGSSTRANLAGNVEVNDESVLPPIEMVTFSLDGREVSAPKGEILIAAAEKAGTFIPRFCYHPRM